MINWAGSKMTTYDPVKHIIKGTEGAWGPEANGKLTLSSATPFTKIIFRQTVLRGGPNGVLIDEYFTF